MAQLFKNKTLKAELKDYQVPDFDKKMAIVKSWHEAYKNGSLKKKTETQCEQAFNQSFFVEILGYTAFPSETYTIDPKGSTETGGQKPDAILGYFSGGTKRVTAVVEIKDANTPLDKSQQREGNLSPIQQAFKYKPQFKECTFVIATNFFELRLLKDNQLDFERFTLEELVNEKDDYFSFKKFYYLLNAGNFISKSGKPQTESILAGIRIEEEQITKKFYSEYKGLRKELIKNITENLGNQASLNFPLIVEKAQKIIDRIVFICFCEDLGLLPENKLIEVIEYGQKSPLPPPIWDTMKQFFVAIDSGSQKLGIPNGYNGELFKTDTEINAFKIDDAICRKFADFGKYDFAEDLSVNILGHIFEQSISDIEELKSQQKPDEADKVSKRKKDGIFYTPEYIVDYIVKHSLGTYLEGLEAGILAKHKLKADILDANYEKRAQKAYSEYWEALKEVKVLDPACGSGAFLVRVFDYLLAEHKRVGDILGLNKGVADFTGVYKNILQKNIYGVDLNPESVEITKLSLWLKTANKGQKLVTLKDNIKCGNSLIDDEAVAGTKAFSWKKEFAEIFKNGGFDVIVGNPPYGASISKEEQSYFISKYQTASYKLDTFGLFTEKGISLLRANGFISYIMPYTWLTIQQHKKLRELVLKYQLNRILDMPQKIFDDADLDTVVFVIKKTIPKNEIVLERLDNQFQLATNKLSLSHIKNDPDLLININNSDKDYVLLEKIKENSKPLQDMFDVSQGYIPYRRSDLIIEFGEEQGNRIVDERLWHSNKPQGDDWKLEIQGKEIRRYGHSVPVGAYIKYGKHVAGYVAPKYFNSPRILIMEVTRGNSHKLSCDYVVEEYYNTPSIINVIEPNNDSSQLLFLLSLINSRLFSWYHTKVHPKANATTSIPKILVGDVRKLPVIQTTTEKQKKAAALAQKMIELNKEVQEKMEKFKTLVVTEFGIDKWGKKLNEFYKLSFDEFFTAINRQNISLEKKAELMDFFEKNKQEVAKMRSEIDALDESIDDMVFDLYRLTPEEREVVLSATNT